MSALNFKRPASNHSLSFLPQTKVQLYFLRIFSCLLSSPLQAFLVFVRFILCLCNFCCLTFFHSSRGFCALNLLCMFFSTMYIFGGFSGLLLNDVLAYTPPSCLAFSNSASCAAAGPGLRCHWAKSRCVPWEPRPPGNIFPTPLCPLRPGMLNLFLCVNL